MGEEKVEAKQTQLEILEHEKREALEQTEMIREKRNTDLKLFQRQLETLKGEITKGEVEVKKKKIPGRKGATALALAAEYQKCLSDSKRIKDLEIENSSLRSTARRYQRSKNVVVIDLTSEDDTTKTKKKKNPKKKKKKKKKKKS